jgi:hypothetical protein
MFPESTEPYKANMAQYHDNITFYGMDAGQKGTSNKKCTGWIKV